MIELSSRITALTKLALPGIFLAGCPTWVVIATKEPRMLLGAVLWPFACLFVVWWTAPLKKVSVANGHFQISNFIRQVSVPTTHLVRMKEERWNRTPNITLYFDPPTEFGSKVRVIPPVDPFRRREFDRVARLLAGLIQSNTAA